MTNKFQVVIAAMLAIVAAACGGAMNEAGDVIDAQFTQMQMTREIAEQYREVHQGVLGNKRCGPPLMRHRLTAEGDKLSRAERDGLIAEHRVVRDVCEDAWNAAMAVYNNSLTLIQRTNPGPFEQMRSNMTEGLANVSEDAVAQALANETDPEARFRELLRMTAAENPYSVVLLNLSEAVGASRSVGTSLEEQSSRLTELVEQMEQLKETYGYISLDYQ